MDKPISSNVIPVNIVDEMKTSYIDYAMSVIVSRALPDVRDGLKPVHRRILYALHELGMTSDKPHKKSARVVGEVLGKYHPHADASVYDAMVRMAQDFASRYMLVDGHGNFGSVDGDAPAAMRYTEVRMSPLASLMLEDIKKDTVDFAPNFDESLKEPKVLPARFPNLLANGSSGIAVGMATNIPPHNLREVIDGTVELINNPDSTVDELRRHIKGPDFPTGGIILGANGIKEAYQTGRGVIRVRGQATIEPTSAGKSQIIVTEIPYQVSKSRLVAKIADLVREKKLDGLTDIRDESDRRGIRLVIELRKDANPNVVLNRLYKFTPLEQTFGIIMLALVDGRPKTLSLKETLSHYVDHQRIVITRRTRYDLQKAEERAHILEGLITALDNIDRVISLIRSSPTVDEAKNRLITEFQLSDRQAQAILDMRLQRLAGLERKKIEEEHKALVEEIASYKHILSSQELLDGIIKDELLAVRDKFSDDRRTAIAIDDQSLEDEDLIPDEDIIITLSSDGYVKRQSVDTYRRQHRGGRGVSVATLREGDEISQLVTTTTHRFVLMFTTAGKVYRVKAHHIPEFGRHARGIAITNLVGLAHNERITAILPLHETEERNRYLVMVSKTGYIKKTPLELCLNITRAGLRTIMLQPGDEVCSVDLSDGESDIMVVSRQGRAIRFSEHDVRSMGRAARGVRALRLKPEDTVLSMIVIDPQAQLLTVSERGYGKRTSFSSFRTMRRGGLGVIASRVDLKSGALALATAVKVKTDLLLISKHGIIIRVKSSQVARHGRAARGVTLMRLDVNDAIVTGLSVRQGELNADPRRK